MKIDLFIDQFAAIVRQHRDRAAILVNGKTAFTYGELDSFSDQISVALRPWTKTNQIVGLFLEKSPEYYAALIAVWKCGAAWLPLDPSRSPIQLEFMANDCRLETILSFGVSSHQWCPAQRMIDLSTIAKKGDSPDSVTQRRVLRESDLAYVMYTSGTTGTPRGVSIEHRGVVPLLDEQRKAFQVTQSSRCLMYYPTFFDASVSDFGTALLSGAAMLIETSCVKDGLSTVDSSCQETVRLPKELGFWDMIHRRSISHADIPPALLKILSSDSVPKSLKTVIIGGDACDIETARKWSGLVNLVNVYGPTEATVCSSLCRCRSEWNRPLLGKPLPSVVYLIVDPELRPVQLGQPGELLIGGPGVARGYINQPEITRDKFIRLNGIRYYRSGDLVRQDNDGEYVFLGRIDRQISLNGFRVEPQEIELLLQQLPGVRAAAVLKRKLKPSSPREVLVAYLESDEQLLVSQIKEFLLAYLPANKIPSVYETHRGLLRLPSGKIDLRGLQNLPIESSKSASFSEAKYHTPLEFELLRLFQNVLQDANFDIDDDFLSSGGDSLGAMQICVLGSTVGISIPMSYVFEFRTVSRLAGELHKRSFGANASINLEDGCSLCLSANWLRQDIAPMAENIQAALAASEESTRGQSSTESTARDIVLLTGATGFLGCRILFELLRSTECQVICLVRGADDSTSTQRLREHLNRQAIQLSAIEWQRITVMASDLESPRFALNAANYSRLIQGVKSVIHCAANTNSISNYSDLRKPNIEGLANILMFLSDCPNAILFHASTLSVFAGSDRFAGEHFESDDLKNTSWLHGGYAQSKWAAEELLRASGLHHSRFAILRFGLLTGDTESGVVPCRDILTLLTRGIARLGCIPVLQPDVCFDMTPVNIAAGIAVSILRSDTSKLNPYRIWHIGNVATISSEVFFRFLRSRGIPLKSVSWDEFRLMISEKLASALCIREQQMESMSEAAACLGMMRWCEVEADSDAFRPFDLFQATRAKFDTSHTLEFLENIGKAPVQEIEKVLSKSLGPLVDKIRECLAHESMFLE